MIYSNLALCDGRGESSFTSDEICSLPESTATWTRKGVTGWAAERLAGRPTGGRPSDWPAGRLAGRPCGRAVVPNSTLGPN